MSDCNESPPPNGSPTSPLCSMVTRRKMLYAPVKKRVHTDMTTVIVGDARKALFR